MTAITAPAASARCAFSTKERRLAAGLSAGSRSITATFPAISAALCNVAVSAYRGLALTLRHPETMTAGPKSAGLNRTLSPSTYRYGGPAAQTCITASRAAAVLTHRDPDGLRCCCCRRCCRISRNSWLSDHLAPTRLLGHHCLLRHWPRRSGGATSASPAIQAATMTYVHCCTFL